jgi:hypothetical protein
VSVPADGEQGGASRPFRLLAAVPVSGDRGGWSLPTGRTGRPLERDGTTVLVPTRAAAPLQLAHAGRTPAHPAPATSTDEPGTVEP